MPDPSVPDAGVAEELEKAFREHSYLHVKRCKCGAQVSDFRAHVAAVLAAGPVARQVRQARAEALRSAGADVWQVFDPHQFTAVQAGQIETWLTHRADREKQGHDQ